MKATKDKLVASIMKATKSQGEKHLDKLCEYSEQYLNKLLQVIKII